MSSDASGSNSNDALDAVHRQWELATVEIMQAQLAYAEIEGRSGVDDRVVAQAWLRLWRAEERQRELAALSGSLEKPRSESRIDAAQHKVIAIQSDTSAPAIP